MKPMTKQPYEAPAMDVVEVRCSGVICVSGEDRENYTQNSNNLFD